MLVRISKLYICVIIYFQPEVRVLTGDKLPSILTHPGAFSSSCLQWPPAPAVWASTSTAGPYVEVCLCHTSVAVDEILFKGVC